MSVKPAQFDMLHELLNTAQTRHQVISRNVANVNTPGYKRQEVDFRDLLAKVLAGGDGNNLGEVRTRVVEQGGLPERADGNNVDMDIEMGQLSKNALMYQTYAQVLSSNLAMMRSAIMGR
jgi:flagellar basal-body rod protein FlgB